MVLASFLVGLLAVLAGTGYAGVRGFALWRRAKGTGGAITAELALFEERAVRTERLLAEAERSSKALLEAQERLRVSLARLQVLTASLESAQRKTAWLRAFVPSR